MWMYVPVANTPIKIMSKGIAITLKILTITYTQALQVKSSNKFKETLKNNNSPHSIIYKCQ